MDDELEAAHGIALTTYDVLRQLALADDGRLRMSELADRVMLSRSGLTGVVSRLQTAGLVSREPCAEDGRGYYAVITPTGRRRLLEAHATHVASIRRHFADKLDEQELNSVHDLLGRLLD